VAACRSAVFAFQEQGPHPVPLCCPFPGTAERGNSAYGRYFQKLAGRPVHKDKYNRQSVWITSDLFQFKATGLSKSRQGKTIYDYKLSIGTDKLPVGELKFKAHDEHEVPATITISKKNGKWYLSFSYEKNTGEVSEEDKIAYSRMMTEDELALLAWGGDRGVHTPLADSEGHVHGFADTQKERLGKNERNRKHYQKQMAKRAKGSNRRKKSAWKAAQCAEYGANI
jgi:putative transposase